MLVVNTNLPSLTTQNALQQNSNALQTAMTRLSTGLRINSAADDPSGLNIAQKMGTRITGLNQANQNTKESIALVQTADSAMQQIYNNLDRMRQIAIQAANGTTNKQDRAGLQKEMNQLAAEVTRITKTTEYNGRSLLTTTKPSRQNNKLASFFPTGILPRGFRDKSNQVDFQIGFNGGRNNGNNPNLIRLDLSTLALDATPKNKNYGLNTVAATQGKFDFTSNQTQLKQKLDKGKGKLNLANLQKSRKAIDNISKDIVKIADVQAVYGALQNRFNQVMNTNTAYANSLSTGKSAIMDANFASEASNMTKYNILQQASTAMLRQANQTPQMALTLLQ